MKILIIRFRQMGDTLVATAMFNTLRKSFPEATIDLVLNDSLAPLFRGHPAIDNIITFTPEERHRPLTYIKKVWQTVHSCHYDAIIDMRSTPNTLLFPLFSLRTRYRIGLRKPYSLCVLNHRVAPCRQDESMISHNLRLLNALQNIAPLSVVNEPSLAISDEEKTDFRNYMQHMGIDFSRPVLLAGVTAKLAHKTWSPENMAEVIRRIIADFPDCQIIFNFAPGKEAENAHSMYRELGEPKNIFINIEARTPRELAAMCASTTVYFGNEGGTRHIAQAMGCPSWVICAPGISKQKWLPQDEELAQGLAVTDLLPAKQLDTMTAEQQYAAISVEDVWERLRPFIARAIAGRD